MTTKTWAFVPDDYCIIDCQGNKQRVLYVDCSRGEYADNKAIHPNYRGKLAVDFYYASHLALLEPMTLEQLEAIPGYEKYHEDNSIDLFNKVFKE